MKCRIHLKKPGIMWSVTSLSVCIKSINFNESYHLFTFEKYSHIIVKRQLCVTIMRSYKNRTTLYIGIIDNIKINDKIWQKLNRVLNNENKNSF